MKTVVLSLGGSVLIPSLESHRIGAYVRVLQTVSEKLRLFVVVGGGGEARRYIAAARSLGLDEATSDEVGILVTRLNATLLMSALRDSAYPHIASNQTEALRFAESGRIVVMGGITPAQTTDAVAAVLAERCRADLLVNATAVDGIYSADPKIDPSARKFERLSAAELVAIVSRGSLSAGSNTVIDMIAAKVIERSGIPLLVIDGRDPPGMERALLSGEYTGTLVCGEGKDPFPLVTPAGKR